MQKTQEYLRFGQIIRIHGHKCLQNDFSKKQQDSMAESLKLSPKQHSGVQTRGMIAVKGFTDKDAKYLTFQHFKNCEFYRQTLFQILPRGFFQKCDNAEEELKKKKLYEELCAQRMGEYVKFGEDVVFRHVDSLDYLSGSVRCSDGGLGAFRVELSDKLLINLVFKLYPFRSFEKEGDKIKLESPLRIKNIENRCYFSTQKNQNKYSIVTTYSQSFTWLIHLHQSHQTLTDTDRIQTHDILFLRHTKNDGYLCLDKKRNEDAKVQIVPCIKLPLEQTGYHCFTCLWEIQKFCVPKISPYFQSDKVYLGTDGTYSLRQLLTGSYLEINKVKETKEGGVFGSQTILEEPNFQISIKSAKGLPNVSDYLKHNGLIKIGGPKSGQSSREDQIDAAEQIKTVSESLRYREQSPYQVNEVKKSEAQSEHGFRIIKIDEESKREVLLILSTFEVLDEFINLLKMDTLEFGRKVNSKKIETIDLTLQKLIAFIKNCSLKDIELDVLPVKKRQFICMDLQICQKLFDILKEMGIKILEQIYKTFKVQNEAFKTTFNRAYYLILQIIKSNPVTKLYVCESWLDIILDHAIQNEEERVHETLNQILQSNQLVVTKFLKANNNHLVQRIIDIFTLKPPHQKFLNIFRASCMSNGAPIVGNQKLILNLFFRSLDDVSKFKFIATLKNDDQEIPIAQRGQGELALKAQPQIKQIKVRCYISKDHVDTRSLKDFFRDSSRLDLSQTSNYFIAYLNLLADICYGRNTEAKKYVEQIMVPTTAENIFGTGREASLTSLDTLIGILEDKEIQTVKGSNNLLRAVIRLINYAYVVSADQNPVLRINRYRNLDNMEKEKVRVGPKFKKVMKFIKHKLSSFESFFSIQINENDNDKKQKQIISLQEKDLMLTVLQLLKSTLVIGYWTVKQQQYELFPLLLKILSNQKKDILHNKEKMSGSEEIRQFEKFKSEASQSTLSVELIKNCKALACELIEIIFDFRHDNLVTECVNFYKEKGHEELHSIMEIPGGSIELNLANTTSNVKVHPLYNAELWKQTMEQIFKQPSDEESRQVRQATKNMSPLMVELSIHKDPVLFFRSLKIMKRHFQYRNDIMKLFLSLSIYDNENGVKLAQQINQKRKILGKLEEENLLYSSDKGVYDDIMDFLVWLSESIKQGVNLSIRPDFVDYVNIFSHFNEESRINKFHQRLIKNKDLHPIMLNFIGLSKQPIRDFKGDSRLVLKYVYRFLSLLAKSFSEAKSEMIHMKDKIFDHVKQQCENITIKHDPEKRRNVQREDMMGYEQYDIESAQHMMNLGEVKESDLRQLPIRDDCEAITLLAELFSHNKHIIYNQVFMEQISIQVSEMINTAPIKNYYKSHLLDFFRTMIYYKDGHIKSNQARILAKLQDSKKKSIYYRLDKANSQLPALTPQYIGQLVEKWEEMNRNLLAIKQPGEPYPLQKDQQQFVVILPQLTYFITMLNLFANLVEGKHDVNIGKCRQVHRYVDLMKVLKNSSICYPLKTHLRQYINELYYSTKIEQDLCTQIIREQIPLIIDDLNILICILVKNRQGKYKLVHPTRFKYYDTYIYLYIEQIIFSLNYLQSDPTFIGILTRQLKEDFSNGYFYLHYYIMRIYERLRWLLNYFYGHKYIRGFLNKVTNQMKNDFLKDFQKNMFKTFDRNQEKMHDPADYKPSQKRPKKQLNLGRQQALKKRSKDLLYKLVKAQIKQYFTVKRPQKDKNFPLTFVLPYGDQTQNPQQKSSQNANTKEDDLSLLAEKLRILFAPKQNQRQKERYRKNHHLQLKKLQDSLLSNAEFNLFMTQFKASQCIELYKIDEFSKSHYGFMEKFVSLQEYIKNFVKVNTEEPDSISNDLKIFFFEVLLEYITQHNKNLQKSVEDWQKDDWQDSRQQIIKSQMFLSGADVAGLIIENLKSSDDIYLSAHVLLFGIAYLIGGNKTCQTSILQQLKEDTKNDVFIKIEKLISRLGKKITTRIAERTSHKQPYEGQFVVQALDQYDYYDEKIKAMKRSVMVEKTSKDEEEEDRIERAVFSRLFKFLQLLCECNNYDLKHFVRIQTNTDGTKKNYSFNVINMTTFEIRRLFKVMCQQACKVVLPLTDFLNEVVTVPCTENQASLCETTFFEDLCYMANTFSDIRVRQARKFDEPQSKKKLFQIYQKCILIILNVLEGNQPKLNRELLIKLDVSFLLFVIKQNLKILNIYNRNDLRELLYNVELQRKKVPCQLQNAVNVMIILLKLQDCQGSERFREKKAAYLKEYSNKPPSEKAKLGQGVDSAPQVNPKMQLQDLLVALKEEMLMIEVVSSKGNQKIYFPKHPILTKLSGATRDRIMTEVSRSTQRQKIKSLFSFKQDIFTEIEHNFKIQKQKFLFGLMSYQPSTIAKLQEYSFKASYLGLVLWFLTTDIIVEYHEVIYFEPYFIRPLLFGINLVQLFITLAYFSSYKVCTYELAKFRAKKYQEAMEKQEERLKPKKDQQVAEDKEAQDQQKKDAEKAANSSSGVRRLLQGVGGWLINKLSSSQLFVLLKFDQKFKYVLMYLITSLLGTFYSQTAFLIYIIYFFLQNETLSNVFNAIFYNLNQLFSVGLLGVVFVYIFSLIFYQTYALDIMAQKDPDEACDSIIGCIMDLYVSGTIGGSVDEFTFMRFATDLIYFIFFGLLFGNIVSGIMIDTFAELRSKREEMNDDKKNRCYICGKDRAQLQKANQNFDFHIQNKHFLWNYIYYMYCLKEKNLTEFSGLQYEIKEFIDKGENDEQYIQWIPFSSESGDEHGGKIDQLSQTMKAVNTEANTKIGQLKAQSSKGSGEIQADE